MHPALRREGRAAGAGDAGVRGRSALTPRRCFLLPDGRRWPGGPDEGPPSPLRAQRRRSVSTINGRPSPLPLSHPGEGFPAPVIATAHPTTFSGSTDNVRFSALSPKVVRVWRTPGMR
ncbi:hypothetical protein BOSEA31B_11903 [Hyphomicrobiales bacterium]|nr:hypothetical protein BOSEA31B_11903 [Hyphomicrobiales bacterium]